MGFADFTFMNKIDGFTNFRPSAPLITHLHKFVVLSSSFNHNFAFARIMAARFFDISMLPRFYSKNSRRGVPVVASCTNKNINIFIIEDFSEVLIDLRSLARDFLDLSCSVGSTIKIWVRNKPNLHTRDFRK